jgi:hypothetical protein
MEKTTIALPRLLGSAIMRRHLALAALSAVILTAILPVRGAENNTGTTDKAVCPGPVAPGSVRCHAHIVMQGGSAKLKSPVIKPPPQPKKISDH